MATALSGDTGWNYANHAGDYGIDPGSNHKRLDLDAFAVGRRWRDIGRRTTTSHGLGSDSSNSRAKNKARNAGLVLQESSKIGRAHVCTPVTNDHLVCRLLLHTQKDTQNAHTCET